MSSRIAKLLSFVRTMVNGANVSDVKIDIGGGDNKTAQHFSSSGDDSFPLRGDYALTSDVAGSGNKVAHGYVDPLNEPESLEGEKRIYARDPATGLRVVWVWLKNNGRGAIQNDNGFVLLGTDGNTRINSPNGDFQVFADGSIKGSNSNGSFELEVGGDFVVNGVTIAANGDVTIPNSLSLSGKEIADHDHGISGGSSAPGPTGVNN